MAGAKPSKTSCFVPLSTLSVDSKIMELKLKIICKNVKNNGSATQVRPEI